MLPRRALACCFSAWLPALAAPLWQPWGADGFIRRLGADDIRWEMTFFKFRQKRPFDRALANLPDGLLARPGVLLPVAAIHRVFVNFRNIG